MSTMLTMATCFFLEPLLITPPTNFISHERPTVKTSDGWVKGRVDYSRNQREYFSFQRIPYAEPPLGNLRFKAPVPNKPWVGLLDASYDAPLCIQKDYLFTSKPPATGQEDCLYLNVYTRKLPKVTIVLLPVMVYIHYGGFFSGTGQSQYHGPQYFMDRDVVLVTFNYRVGVLGFLSTNDDAAPGNWALKDQVLLLKWVQRNIEYFGGNKNQVTIFGQSAGAGSVHHHILSPSAKGLFHAAIAESGAALTIWGNPQSEFQAQIAKQTAQFLGCNPNTTTTAMVNCLRKIDAEVLVDSADLFKYFQVEPVVVYMPVIEKRTIKNPYPYLTEEPISIIKRGDFNKVPWILGVNEHEGILRASPLLRSIENRKQLENSFQEYFSNIIGLGVSTAPDTLGATWNAIYSSILDNKFDVNDPKWVSKFIHLIGDRYFIYGTYQSALIHSIIGHAPIWFYNFSYRGKYSYEPEFALTQEKINYNWGTSHCDELLYLFKSPALFGDISLDKNDRKMSDIMIDLWTKFATHGEPSSTWFPLPNLTGKNAKNSDFVYLNITGNYKDDKPIKLKMQNTFHTKRMRFWKNLPLKENLANVD